MFHKLKSIEKLSENYMRNVIRETYSFVLANGKKEIILNSWWLSLLFFFDRVFYQGRTDKLSYLFERATIKALEDHLGENDEQKLDKLVWFGEQGCLDYKKYKFQFEGNELSSPWSEIKKILNKKYPVKSSNGSVKPISTGKIRDRQMTVDTLNFIYQKLEEFEYNILKFTIYRIKNKELKELYNELKSIHQVGEKTASLFLRDVVVVYDLKDQLTNDDYVLLQPIDTWVRQISKSDELALTSHDTPEGELRNKIVQVCLEAGISPIRFNQGIWYLGTHSLELILSGFTLSSEDR